MRARRLLLPLIAAAIAVGSAEAASVSNTAVTPNDGSAWQQPSLAQDPAQPSRVAVAYQLGTQYSSRVCELALSSNGGRSWRRRTLVGAGGRFPIPAHAAICNNPRIAYGPQGELYYVFSTIPKPPPAGGNKTYVFFMRSLDGGRSFAAPRLVSRPSSTPKRVGDYYQVVAADPAGRRVYVSFSRTDSTGNKSDTYIAVSSNRGRTFSRPVRVSRQTTTENGTLAVAGDGTVYLGFDDLSATYVGCGTQPPTFTCPGYMDVARSRSHGRSFRSVRIASFNAGCPGPDVDTKFGFPSAFCTPLHTDGYAFYTPQVAAGTRSETAYAVWWGGDPQGPARVFFSRTRNGGRSWSAPVAFPGGGAGHEQYLPAIAVAPNGRVDVIYYDHVYYNRGLGFGYDNVMWVHSSDGGRRFSAAVRLTTRTSDTGIGPLTPFGSVPSFGNFLGLVSTNRSVLATWTDSRRGRAGTVKQDIYFGRVSLR